MKNTKTIWKLFLATIAVVAALFFWKLNTTNTVFLARYNLYNKDIKSIVNYLENKTNESSGFQASINSQNLILKDSFKTLVMELPSDEFYLSVAPYEQNTHPCGIHNLITCRGEMKQQAFEVKVVNDATSEVIYHQTTLTLANGFLGLWLPRDVVATLTITQGLKSATGSITTFNDSNTCLTTLRLV